MEMIAAKSEDENNMITFVPRQNVINAISNASLTSPQVFADFFVKYFIPIMER